MKKKLQIYWNYDIRKNKSQSGTNAGTDCIWIPPTVHEKNISYSLHLEPDIELNCDIDKMERVFDNLLKNAVHYSYANTTIHISAYRESLSQSAGQTNENIVIQMDNCGKTIPQEKLLQLFEPFFRMDSSRASYSGGAGLGLAIAKEIVEAHGGNISCISEEEHICFKIVLPSA